MVIFQGVEGFERLMDRLMGLSEYMVSRIQSMPDKFYLLFEPEMVNVSFWYIPTRLRGVPHSPSKEKTLGEVRWPKINAINSIKIMSIHALFNNPGIISIGKLLLFFLISKDDYFKNLQGQ